MKKLLLSLLCIGFAGLYSAQDVITFFEDFQDLEFFEDAAINGFEADPDQWTNYDSDGLETNAGLGQAWRRDSDIIYFTLADDPGDDSNYVAASDSYLNPIAPGNRNYLILPEIEITDESHFLSWKSGAFQGPRYMDGYSVGIVTDMSDVEGSYVQLWTAAQFAQNGDDWYGPDYDFTGCPLPNTPPVDELDFESICYFPTPGDGLGATGYVHANNWTLPDYLGYQNNADSTATTYLCLLEPHEISLADYIGQTVRICILHDSDDDNYITIDDVMVSSGITVGVPELTFSRFISMYPNPVADQLNFNFTEEVKDNAVINVIDAKGSIVYSEVVSGASLRNVYAIDLSAYTAGLYSISVTIDNKQTISDNIIKR